MRALNNLQPAHITLINRRSAVRSATLALHEIQNQLVVTLQVNSYQEIQPHKSKYRPHFTPELDYRFIDSQCRLRDLDQHRLDAGHLLPIRQQSRYPINHSVVVLAPGGTPALPSATPHALGVV
jgi:hypothetical protein